MRDELYTERIELCLTKKQKQLVKDNAQEHDMTMNEVIRKLIVYLED